ncbi:large ribosomal RNA subunit accumulation protein YCED homolog 2, chloroplastic isoform X2 [Humulus lupulus]|nr:large ribosomal RNA subunit accumulation protein YCED homolog 2, chloroplastic isoform X2 [Humulus lupulus]
MSKRSSRSSHGMAPTPSPRRLITISTGDGRWQGKWDSEYLVSLQDLKLTDLVELEDDLHHHHHQKDALVSVKLKVEKHASFGFSVDGRIITSFPRKCSSCSSPYCRQIDTEFNVWVLLSKRDNREVSLPELGGDDPSVIYVKPGSEADLDTFIQDTIRITTSIKDTCSELCEKSSFTLHNNSGSRSGSIDQRWSRLLELKKSPNS